MRKIDNFFLIIDNCNKQQQQQKITLTYTV